MADVNAVEAVLYGFKHSLTMIVIVILGFLFLFIGLFMMTEELVELGLVVSLVGVGIVMAGSTGLAYKLIADAVRVGVTRAGTTPVIDQDQRKARKIPDAE